MFCRLNCLVCTAYPISPACTGEKLTHIRLTQKRQKVRNRHMGNACTNCKQVDWQKSPTSGTGLSFLALTNLGPRNSCRSSTELLFAPYADLVFSHLLTREEEPTFSLLLTDSTSAAPEEPTPLARREGLVDLGISAGQAFGHRATAFNLRNLVPQAVRQPRFWSLTNNACR